MFRNKALTIEWIVDLAATVLFAVAGFFVHPAAGALLLALGAGLCGFHLYLNRKRYGAIAALSRSIDRILHGQDRVLTEGSEEGELAILHSEIGKMTVRLRTQTDQLLADKRLLSDAIADLFHQIRTPLTSMNLTVSLLADDRLAPETRLRYLHELKGQLARIQWITETLLKLSKLDAQTVRFAPESVSVAELIGQAAEPLRIQMELKDVDFTVEGDATIALDRAWTVEALSNILKNCFEHTPSGGGIAVRTESSPVFVRIFVRDSGTGFDPMDLPHVFERFYRGRNASADSIGIGLALTREIVASQNGTVTAKNVDGGALFTVTFYRSVL